jgi:hypothetical protein
MDRSIGQAKENEAPAADARVELVYHAQSESRCNRRIDRIASLSQHLQAGTRGRRMGRDHQPRRFRRESKIVGSSLDTAGKGQERHGKEEKEHPQQEGEQKGVRNLFVRSTHSSGITEKVPYTFL